MLNAGLENTLRFLPDITKNALYIYCRHYDIRSGRKIPNQFCSLLPLDMSRKNWLQKTEIATRS